MRRFPNRFQWAVVVMCLGMASALDGHALADRMFLLDDPVKAAQVRVDLLEQARTSIRAQYFVVGDDPLSYAGLALARDACWRGCDVRIIIDARFDAVPPAVAGYLMTQGVQIKLYHPFRLSNLKWMTRRMHDKGLSIDGTKMIRGSRNVQNGYFGLNKTNFVDRDAYVEGKVVRHADEYFDRLWESDEVSWVETRHLNARQFAEGQRQIEEARHATAGSKKWKLNTRTDWGHGLRDVGPIEFLHDPVGEKNIEPGIAESLRDLLRKGHRSILMETPYLIPTPELFREIGSARARGVKTIDIITNSAGSNDGEAAQAGYEKAKGSLLKAGVNLWEFKGLNTLHAKSGVIDSQWAIVGSFNLDPRSQHLNTETAVAVKDPEIAAELARSIDAHKRVSWRIGPDGRPVGDATGYPGAPRDKRMKIAVLRVLLPLIRMEL